MSGLQISTNQRDLKFLASAWQYVEFMYSGYSSDFYCVGFGLVPNVPTPPQCLIERCICRRALVASKWRTAFVCGTGKEMVQTGPEALICLWQTDGLARWPLLPDGWLSPYWHCNVCSHCQLLLKVIYALKIHPALIEAANRKIPSGTERRIQFFLYIDLLFTVISGLFFFFTSLLLTRTCLKLLWFFSAPRLQWNSWRAPDLLMFHVPEVTLTFMCFVGWRGSLPGEKKKMKLRLAFSH